MYSWCVLATSSSTCGFGHWNGWIGILVLMWSTNYCEAWRLTFAVQHCKCIFESYIMSNSRYVCLFVTMRHQQSHRPNLQMVLSIRVIRKVSQRGQNHSFDLSLRKHYIKHASQCLDEGWMIICQKKMEVCNWSSSTYCNYAIPLPTPAGVLDPLWRECFFVIIFQGLQTK